MKFRTFAAFVGPSLLLMMIFIAAPLVSVLWQSFHLTQNVFETVETERCTPGFPNAVCETITVDRPVLDENGEIQTVTSFVGWQSYSRVLDPDALGAAISSGDWWSILNIDFWGALRFTLTFTLVTLPLVIGVGLLIAITVNNAVKTIRGPAIFISLLPFIITPVIGALSIRWLFVGDGILTALMESWSGQDIAMFAQGWTIELLMMFYRVWHVAPFAFVIFYAGLQTVNMDTLESAIIDGASRFERLRYVIVPHLMPLIVFIALIHLMDSYRVFEEVIGFRSEAHRISLQWLTFDYLTPDDSGNRSVSRASASSMLTMVGIVILLVPLLRRTWRDHKGS
ncbi:carbohydrate ABC transporter permease [Pontivivens insulae]|uniref:L-arabinose transport system permease protein AraP n=1 Tax=Pontivivens insulae TaxID=1639689 RepID=A0A2R8AAX3_9RHOB|nr:sugar ABC transporter permease [Pontivivens insulae]RED13146.1 carbohydrate ABC transporter membrane protein 1 (CUT1 family) [Pontivivens insulae]SPF29238.1 L-arabinose transport system permease protein AraP [Pontivivens insulae]